MIKTIFHLFLCAVFSISANAESTVQGKISGGVSHEMPTWFTDSFLDINEDIEEAGERNKKVMLFFHLSGCPYCDAILNENFRGGSTTEFIKRKYSVIAVNIKGDREITLNETTGVTEKSLSQQLKVQYTPTIIFIDENREIILRINGYRSAKAFAHLLNYIDGESYKSMTLSSYIEKKNQKGKNNYEFIKHGSLEKINYFKGIETPVAILFEDKDCTDCEFLHKSVINQPDVTKELDEFLFVRFDAYSDEKIIDFNGQETTPRRWVDKLELSYRPGIVLFDNKKEITRIDGKLYSFHFKEVLRYVSGKYYKKYSSYNTYLAARQNELLNNGIDIDISK